ncbi:hypothetical protein A6U95_01505 [Serratia sp. 14-2641]|nr:hypothetical protein A6U95_01505 [Serratia sp. 14-2641]
MNLEELNFSLGTLQWVIMAVIGIYTWLTGRQAASNQELQEQRTRLARLEEQLSSLPTQLQITELISKLSHTEAQLAGLNEQFGAVSRRLETINNYLLQKK